MNAPNSKPEPTTDSRAVTLPLATAQTLFWASTFYLLPALLPTLERNTSWSKAHITGAFTAGLFLSAFASPIVGRGIDKGFGRTIMCTSATIAGLLLLLFSFSNSLFALYFCWSLLGLCMAGLLYEPCFAIVTRHYGQSSRKIITHITLIAGFAGTVSFPLANYLAHHYDWQTAVRAFVFLTLIIALPLAFVSLSGLMKRHPVQTPKETISAANINNKSLQFWFLALAFTLGGINQGMITTHLLPMLQERGIGQSSAIIAAMLIGPMQVLGRFALMSFEEKISATKTGLICLGGLTCSTLALYFAGASLPLIYVSTSLQGATWGLISIARPSITRELLGQENFGAISGKMGGIFVFGVALAPALGSQIWRIGGYNTMLIVGISMAGIGLVLLNIAYGFKGAQ